MDSRDEVGKASGWGGGLVDLDGGGRGVEVGVRGGRGWGEEVVGRGREGDVGLGGDFDEGYFL